MRKTAMIRAMVGIVFLLGTSVSMVAQQAGESLVQPYLKEYNTVIRSNPSALLIENVRIIDGHGGKPVEKGFVVVKNGMITHVGSGEAVKELRKDTEIINGEGKSLLPGLIDAHLHTVNDNEIAQLFLANGVTSFRDPGHPFTFYQSIVFADKPLPRIFLTGAHLDYPPAAYGQQATLVRSNEHAGQMVDSYYKNGATAVKIYFRLPLKFYKDVIAAAANHKIPVVAHLELVSAVDAITAGINGVEHVTSFGTSIAEKAAKDQFISKVEEDNNARRDERYRLWASVDMESPKVKEVIKLALSKNVVLCPTLAAFEKQPDTNGTDDFKVKGFRNMIKFVEIAHKEGLKVVIGSHSHVEYAKTGEAYLREMELLQMAGMTPLEIIKAGTVLNAGYFMNSSRLGSIEAGKAADLILVNGDPSINLSAMHQIEAVMLNGTWVKNKL